jgi:tetratricopeptide (TPR) repeat protein
MTREHRSATPSSITYEEFVQAVIAGQAEQAIAEVRALLETEPEHILLQETYLQRLVWSLVGTWGLSEQAMPVIKFTAELYPASVNTQWLLAEGQKDVGNYAAAIEAYNRLLEKNPDNDYFKSQLEWLRSQ